MTRLSYTLNLALASNRASKVDLLLADNNERCDRIAYKHADRLVHDSLEAIANGDVLGRNAQELANIAISARDRVTRRVER